MDIIADELIHQYARGELAPAERKWLEANLLQSPEARAKLRFAVALGKRGSELGRGKAPQPATRWWGAPGRSNALRTYLPLAASLLLVAGLGFGVWRAFIYKSDVDRGLAALRAAYSAQRPVEARVSVFDYAESAQTRGEEKADSLQRELAASLLAKAVLERPDAESLRALGQYYTAARQFDQAVEYLSRSLELDPADAKTHSDLGAALLERGKSRGDGAGRGDAMRDYGESLQHLNKALELDAGLLEALFNRALVHEELELPEPAKADWRGYLAKDGQSKWAAEARARLRALEDRGASKGSSDAGRLLADFRVAYERRDEDGCRAALGRAYSTFGNAIIDALVDSYIDAGGGGGDEAQVLVYAGELESDRTGDRFAADLARFYRQASPARLGALAAARGRMKGGHRLLVSGRVDDAVRDFRQAGLEFARAGDEWEALLAEYLTGVGRIFQLDRPDETEALFRRLLSRCDERRYTWLHGHGLYRLAMLLQHYNQHTEAIEYARQALAKFELVGDANGILKVIINLADEYETLNDERQALGLLHRGLSLVRAADPEWSQLWMTYTALGLNFASLGLTSAAIAYQQQALRLALETGLPIYVSRSHAYLGVTYSALRRDDEALAHIRQALDAGGGLLDQTSGQEMVANASLYAGEIYRRRGEQDKAVESYDRAIDFYAKLNFPYFRYAAHKGKLLSLLARDNDPSAEGELRTVLDIFEQYRIDLTSEGQRNTFFDVEQGVYDRVMDFAYTRKQDAALAFDYSELSRARSLLDAMRQGVEVSAGAGGPELRLAPGSTPLLLSEIQRRMPGGTQVLQFAVLDDKVLAWLVTRTEMTAVKIDVDARTLEGKVRAYLRALNGPADVGAAEAARLAAELHAILIKGFEGRLDATKLLCVVPDKVLHYLPFAALISGDTSKYLVEDYRLVRAPSATVFVECSERALGKAGATVERLLSVGDPVFDRKAFPALRALPAAAAEARGVAALYKSSPRVLLGADATEGAIRGSIGQYEVINFALHYVVNEQSGMLSGMPLAGARASGAEDDNGFWQVYEIYKTGLPRAKLVVLSACQTGVEQNYGGEGPTGAARPFVAAGVPVVVASLWPVNSESTAQLVVAFHRERTVGRATTAEALRRAQLALIQGDDERHRHPHHWAAFTAIGGHTEF